MSAPTYLFYDLETTGLNPAFDQIVQFATIKTDAQWQVSAEHEIRVKLRPDIVTFPGALLTLLCFSVQQKAQLLRNDVGQHLSSVFGGQTKW
jgi:exonuclease I